MARPLNHPPPTAHLARSRRRAHAPTAQLRRLTPGLRLGSSIGHLCAVLLGLHLFRRRCWSVMLHMLHMLTFLSFGLRRGLQAGIAFCRAIGGRHHDHRLSCIHPLPLPRQGLRCLRRGTRRSGRALRESAGYHTRPRPTRNASMGARSRAADGSCGTSRRSPASHPRRPKSRESTVRLPCFAPRRTGLSNLARSTSTFHVSRVLGDCGSATLFK